MSFLRKLVWLYFLLLVFEGALRKWIVPALDAPLLIIRDPVVCWIYFVALNNKVSFNSAFFHPNFIMGVLCVVTATLFGIANPLVTIYGIRTDFLQIPLIFLIPQILRRQDVMAMGKFMLYLLIPMAALVVFQFKSPQGSIWNKGAMITFYGTVRPSGTFSFGTGVTGYFCFAAAFLFYGYMQRNFKMGLIIAATFGLLVGVACSGSRGGVVSVGLVVMTAVATVLFRGKGGAGMLIAGGAIAVGVLVLSSMSTFQDSTAQLTTRFADAGETEGGASGFIGRFLSTFVAPLSGLDQIPFFGFGLGLGTNAGLGMFRGNDNLPWPEDEWQRLIFECGPLLGILLCLFRLVLTGAVAWKAVKAFNHGNVLPALLFSACGLTILNGQWGVPTTLGMAIFGAGLTLAACHDPTPEESPDYVAPEAKKGEDEDEEDEEHDEEDEEAEDDDEQHDDHDADDEPEHADDEPDPTPRRGPLG